MDDLKELYNTNEELRRYVDRYSRNRGITVDEALTHELVRQYYLYLEDRRIIENDQSK